MVFFSENNCFSLKMCYNCIQLKNIIVDEHINYDKFLINFGLEDWKVTLFVNKSEGKKKRKLHFIFVIILNL